MVLVPVGEMKIKAALQQAAEKGSPQAAREYRAWLDRYPEQNTTIRPELLSAQRRQAILARLIREVEEEEAALTNSARVDEAGRP
jgi:hypothetical protein